nr:hypothetical protein CFP56_37703 [Quercus suber]
MATFSQIIPLPTSIEMVEVLAARSAIAFAKDLSLKQVIFEGDLETIMRPLSKGGFDSSSYGHITRDIKFLSHGFQNCSFCHTLRHGNKVAHSLARSAFPKKFQSDIRVVRMKELNFILRSKIFMHYDGQLRASHLILDVRLPGFLPKGLTSGETKHLGPRLVEHDSLEPIQDGLRDIIFQGHVEHIPVDAPPLGVRPRGSKLRLIPPPSKQLLLHLDSRGNTTKVAVVLQPRKAFLLLPNYPLKH